MTTRGGRFLNWLIFLLGIATLLSTLYSVQQHFSPVPYADSWDGTIAFYTRALQSPWRAFFEQHNEHRLVFSRLIFYADVRYFGGRNVLSLIANLVLAGVLALAFIRIALHYGVASNWGSPLGLIGGVMIFLFSWMQRENFTWGFQSQWYAVYLFALLAFYALQLCAEALHHGDSARERNWYVAMVAAATAAAGSMASGLLVWPVLVVTAIYLRLRWRAVVLLAVLSAAIWVAYFYTWHSPGNTGSPIAGLRDHPVAMLKYAVFYLGAPADYTRLGPLGAAVCGAIFVAALAAALLHAVARRNRLPLATALLVFSAFVAGNALLTASGRLVMGMDTAFSSRYTTASLTGWLALLLYIGINCPIGRGSRRTLGVTLIALLIVVSFQREAFRADRQTRYERNVAGLALRAHVYDFAMTRSVYPSIDGLRHEAQLGEAAKISIFAPNQPDYPVLPAQIEPTVTCVGALDHVFKTPTPGIYRAQGWIYDPTTRSVPENIALTDATGKPIGSGVTGANRGDVSKVVGKRAKFSGWTALLSAPGHGDIRIVGIVAPSDYCAVAQLVPAAVLDSAAPSD